LQILPQKLAAAGQADRFHRLLTDFDFIDAKISVFGSQSAIEDYDLTKILTFCCLVRESIP